MSDQHSKTMDFQEHIDVLADCCKQVFEEMSSTQVLDVTAKSESDERDNPDYAFAQIITYEHIENRGKHVLVTDDSKTIRKLLTNAPKEVGLEVHTAANGREAVEIFQGVSPDLTVMDLVMPTMTGLEATAAIREIADEVKVIMLPAQLHHRIMSSASERSSRLRLTLRCATLSTDQTRC